MAVPESQLEIWSNQGAIAQSRDTYATIKRALEASDTSFAGRDFHVFLQGSYGNDTNIYAESDVDVVICLGDTYFFDTSALTPQDVETFNTGWLPVTYSYADFKAHVMAALRKSFGSMAVRPSTKAIKIMADGNRRSADVIVTAEFRRYYSATQYEAGVCFFNSSGDRIINYPKQHSANCTAKHQATNGWFKPTVRVLKNMRSRLVQTGAIEPGSAPSYFLEGLLYNVPNYKFGTSFDETIVGAVNWILQADRDDLQCANEEYYLVRDNDTNCWPRSNCNQFLNALAAQWKNWD